MQSEVLLSKFMKLLIFYQTFFPNIPVFLNEKTIKLSPEKLKFPRHFSFVVIAFLSPQIFQVVFFIVVIRIFICIPRSSPEFPNIREIIFFWFYLCVVNLITSAIFLLTKEKESFCDVVNAALKMILEFRAKSKIQNSIHYEPMINLIINITFSHHWETADDNFYPPRTKSSPGK